MLHPWLHYGALKTSPQPVALVSALSAAVAPQVQAGRYTPTHAILGTLGDSQNVPAVTTNYDPLYEDAVRSAGTPAPTRFMGVVLVEHARPDTRVLGLWGGAREGWGCGAAPGKGGAVGRHRTSCGHDHPTRRAALISSRVRKYGIPLPLNRKEKKKISRSHLYFLERRSFT